jgi:hypothetical protein
VDNLKEQIKHLKSLAMQRDFDCGWMRDETINLICAIIDYYKPDVVIHTGFLWGKSTACILNTVTKKTILLEPDNQYRDKNFNHFVDTHTPKTTFHHLLVTDPNMFDLDIDSAYEYLENEYPGSVVCYKLKSQDFFLNVDDIQNSQCLIGIIDGDHTKEGCLNDLVNLHNLGANVLMVDDTLWLPYLDELCREFARENNYDYTNYALYSGLGVLVRKAGSNNV